MLTSDKSRFLAPATKEYNQAPHLGNLLDGRESNFPSYTLDIGAVLSGEHPHARSLDRKWWTMTLVGWFQRSA